MPFGVASIFFVIMKWFFASTPEDKEYLNYTLSVTVTVTIVFYLLNSMGRRRP
jgi:hypothetical protein